MISKQRAGEDSGHWASDSRAFHCFKAWASPTQQLNRKLKDGE
jgi:hypothetical protein